jgi:hypothetical protein
MAATVRVAALAATAIVALGFLVFAADEARQGSDNQIRKFDEEISAPAPSARTEQVRERAHGPSRELLDDANDVLLAPFSGLVTTRDPWVRRLVPTALALLAYGLGLTMLANALPRPRPRSSGDWRIAS